MYSVPVIDNLLDLLQDATGFSRVDLKNDITAEKDLRHYTSFDTHYSEFEFLMHFN